MVKMSPESNKPNPGKIERDAGVELRNMYRNSLAIDPNRLDDCVAKQPELFDHVANAHVNAVAERDAIKLEIEELEAELDKKIRGDAAANDEKITEPAIKQAIKLDRDMRYLQRELLTVQNNVAHWSALKEGYQQRSYMLRELVAMYLVKVTSRSAVTVAQKDLSDMSSVRISEERARRRAYKEGRTNE